MIEALPVDIIHIVDHPEEVPCPPGIATHHQETGGVERNIGTAVFGVREIDAPHRAFMVARFKIGFGEHTYVADRRLVHHRRDIAGDLLVDPNILAARRIDKACAPGGADLIDRPRTEIAQNHASDGFAAR
jgi:hypothetical protein